MRRIIAIIIMTVSLIHAAGCLAEADDVVFTNGGLTFSVPADLTEKLAIECPENNERDFLFSVSEKASIEVAEAEGYPWAGAGWLFSIGCVSEKRYHEMLCDDMNGVQVFAKDDHDVYYMYYHPTDVRLVRENNAYDEESMKAWGELNQWAYRTREKFIAENGLTPVNHGNTLPDIYLARIFYRNDENYTISKTEYGPMEPHGVKASDYIEPLVTGAVFTLVDDEKAPDGEYIVLNFPDENIRFDFFTAEGKENYVRQVWFNGEHELLYKAEFMDETIKASEIMNDMYHDMVLANSLGYTADDMVGVWTDKIAGRCSIDIRKDDAEGTFNVMIHWGSSASEMYV